MLVVWKQRSPAFANEWVMLVHLAVRVPLVASTYPYLKW